MCQVTYIVQIYIQVCMLYNILHMYSIKLYTLHLSLHYLLCTVGPKVFNIKVPHCNTLSILPDNNNSMCSIELYSSLYTKSLSKILTLICRSQSVQYKGSYIELFSSILSNSTLRLFFYNTYSALQIYGMQRCLTAILYSIKQSACL